MTMTPGERRLRAKNASLTRWAHTDNRTAATAAARAARMAKFEQKADPNGKLTPAERAKRGDELFRAHMANIARKSAKARRERKQRGAA